VSNNNTIQSDIYNPMKQLYKNRMLIFYGFQESGIPLVTKQFPYYHEMIVEETNLSSLTCDKKIARSEWFFNRKVEVTNNIEDFLFQEHNSSETYITNYLEVMGEYRSVCPNYLELNLKETEDKEKQKRIKTNYWNKIDERIESYDKIDKQIKREILEERNNQKLKEEQEQKLEDLQEQKQEEEETHDSKPKKYKKQKRKNKKRKY
jgi:tRNA U55 pseudouridine synthase TruB